MNDTSTAAKTVYLLIAVALLAALVVAAVVYMQEPAPPQALPDNSVIAGPVLAVSSTSITVQKQDGSRETLSLTPAVIVVLAGEGGQPGVPKELGDITEGMMVLVTPSDNNTAVAHTVVLLPAPPAQ